MLGDSDGPNGGSAGGEGPDWTRMAPMDGNQPVTVRFGSVADLEAIVSVHLQAAVAGFVGIFPPTAPTPSPASLRPRWLELITSPRVDVYVAEATGVVGCAVVRPEDMVPAGMLLDRLYVHPSHWGHGVGAHLHDTALSAAHIRGVDRLNLWVLEANTKARAIYERWGWKLVPGWTLPNQPPTVLDVLYERVLAGPHTRPDSD